MSVETTKTKTRFDSSQRLLVFGYLRLQIETEYDIFIPYSVKIEIGRFIRVKTRVYGIGWNVSGQFGMGWDTHKPKLNELTNLNLDTTEYINRISGGNKHLFFISDIGEIYCSGLNDKGQLGVMDKMNRIKCTLHSYYRQQYLINKTKNCIKYVANGISSNHSILITNNGKVYGHGANEYNQLGLDQMVIPIQSYVEPINYLNSFKIIHAAINESGTLFLSDIGQIFVAGKIMDIDTDNHDDIMVVLPSFCKEKVVSIACGKEHVLFLTENGDVYGYGDNEIKDENETKENEMWVRPIDRKPVRMEFLKENIKDIDCGLDHSLCLTEDGKIYDLSTEITKAPEIIEVKDDKIEQISAGLNHNVVLTKCNDVYCWGGNKFNQCIQSSYWQIDKPLLVVNDVLKHSWIRYVYAGFQSTLIIVEQ